MVLLKNLYNEHGATVKNIIYKRIKNPSLTEDIMHDTFLCIIKKLSVFEKLTEKEQTAYLFTVAKNLSLNLIRRKDPLPLEETVFTSEENGVDDFLNREFSREDFDIAVKVICDLPEKYRDVLSLYYLTEMKDTDIAALRRENINTVRSKIRRGRQILIEELKKKGVER